MEHISIDDFGKVEIRVGKILTADIVEGSEKLLKLSVDFGLKPSAAADGSPDHSDQNGLEGTNDIRQVVSGIRAYAPVSELVGRSYLFVTNLVPREIMGFESQAMVVACGGKDEPFALFAPTNNEVIPGSRIH